MTKEEYPQDYFVKLNGNLSFLGRITLNKTEKATFNVEIDIVHKESKKIFEHVGMFFGYPDKTEGIDSAIQILAKFLKGKVSF